MDKIDTIRTTAEELLATIGFEAEIEIKEEDGFYALSLNTPDNALLIGKHGNTLTSFEHILSLMVVQKLGDFERIVVEVGDYRKEREEYLKDLANRLRDEVVEGSTSKTIRGLKPWERRFVHMCLAEDSEVVTESEGEGRDRVLVIKKK